ncbi:hypothetical protein [Actinomadura sp. CNU-125]|uniref:hypothetical protein n=1 Tax=Actinomadura sp. CNU-125 TaxID=1904961 RepID=UPI0013015152|nr:hypothetical protein [Actinomadura sp. CNU-125]
MTRERIRDLMPSGRVRWEPSEDLAARAAPIPLNDLVEAVYDGDEPRWRRAACARALTGRVPDERAGALLEFVRDGGATADVRAALLEALSEPDRPYSAGLLEWLRAQEDRDEWRHVRPALAVARAKLGDLSVARGLVAMAADPWTQLRMPGERGVDALIDTCGLAAVLAELGADSTGTLAVRGASADERLLGVRLRWRAGDDIVASLADDSRTVARTAHDLLADADADCEGALWELVRRRAPGHLWALAVLHRRGRDVRSAWEAAGSPRVELPDAPPDVRAAIVRAATRRGSAAPTPAGWSRRRSSNRNRTRTDGWRRRSTAPCGRSPTRAWSRANRRTPGPTTGRATALTTSWRSPRAASW